MADKPVSAGPAKEETTNVKNDACKKQSSSGATPEKTGQDEAKPRGKRTSICFWLIGGIVAVLAALGLTLFLVITRLPPEKQEVINTLVEAEQFQYVKQTAQTFTEEVNAWLTTGPFPGQAAHQQGYTAKHPIVMVPGFVTTGLEVWQAPECAPNLFRKRVWGSFNMLQQMLVAGSCWAHMMSLDMETGLDPEGVRVRPAQGLEGADYFILSYWVWAPLIKNLAAIGYDHSNLYLHTFDWRLSLHDMQKRDHYFSSLKAHIETMVEHHHEKVMLIAHSYGTNVLLYFFMWVQSPSGGGGGPDWVANHIEVLSNLAGPLLGVIKAATSYLSGEMHDTVGVVSNHIHDVFFRQEHFLNRNNRKRMFKSWGSLTAMLPKGGQPLWGNLTWSPEDAEIDPQSEDPKKTGECLPQLLDGENATFVSPGKSQQGSEPKAESASEPGQVIEPLKYGQAIAFSGDHRQNWTIDELISHLQSDPDEPAVRRRLEEDYDFGYTTEFTDEILNNRKYWTNPMTVPLPNAPNMKVVCHYGVGLPTERAYVYQTDDNDTLTIIDQGLNDPRRNISAGTLMGDGDGTVTLLSLGVHCGKFWREKLFNPSGISVTTRELKHGPALTQRGNKASDHVNIMGNEDMLRDILALAAGRGAENVTGNDSYHSSIQSFLERVELPPKSAEQQSRFGGLFGRAKQRGNGHEKR